MNNFFDLIEKYKFGILAAFATYIAIFMYLNIRSYKQYYLIPGWEETAKLELPDEIAIKPENIEQQDFSTTSEDLKSISRSQHDAREKSFENWSQNTSKALKNIEQQVYDLEKQYYAESGGVAQREKIKQQIEDLKKIQQEQEKASTPGTHEKSQTGGDKSYAGSVMVEWTLNNRDAHQNNNWYVRNPGYTCGHGASGKVMVKIKVNQGGSVISATYIPEMSSGANQCMIEQATKYAEMSRFNYSSSAAKIQEGFIIYTFVAQ